MASAELQTIEVDAFDYLLDPESNQVWAFDVDDALLAGHYVDGAIEFLRPDETNRSPCLLIIEAAMQAATAIREQDAACQAHEAIEALRAEGGDASKAIAAPSARGIAALGHELAKHFRQMHAAAVEDLKAPLPPGISSFSFELASAAAAKPGEGEQEEDVPGERPRRARARRVRPRRHPRVGDHVEARWEGDGRYYAAKVTAVAWKEEGGELCAVDGTFVDDGIVFTDSIEWTPDRAATPPPPESSPKCLVPATFSTTAYRETSTGKVDNVHPVAFYKAYAQCADILSQLRPNGDPRAWLLPGMPTGGLDYYRRGRRRRRSSGGDGDSGTSGSSGSYSEDDDDYSGSSSDEDDGFFYGADDGDFDDDEDGDAGGGGGGGGGGLGGPTSATKNVLAALGAAGALDQEFEVVEGDEGQVGGMYVPSPAAASTPGGGDNGERASILGPRLAFLAALLSPGVDAGGNVVDTGCREPPLKAARRALRGARNDPRKAVEALLWAPPGGNGEEEGGADGGDAAAAAKKGGGQGARARARVAAAENGEGIVVRAAGVERWMVAVDDTEEGYTGWYRDLDDDKFYYCKRTRSGWIVENGDGVMHACYGTKQGKSGWYLDPDTGKIYQFEVKDDGAWVQSAGPLPAGTTPPDVAAATGDRTARPRRRTRRARRRTRRGVAPRGAVVDTPTRRGDVVGTPVADGEGAAAIAVDALAVVEAEAGEALADDEADGDDEEEDEDEDDALAALEEAQLQAALQASLLDLAQHQQTQHQQQQVKEEEEEEEDQQGQPAAMEVAVPAVAVPPVPPPENQQEEAAEKAEELAVDDILAQAAALAAHSAALLGEK